MLLFSDRLIRNLSFWGVTLAGLNFNRGPGKNILVRSCFIGIDIWQDGMFFFFFFFFHFFVSANFVLLPNHAVYHLEVTINVQKSAALCNKSLPFTFFIHCLHCSWQFASTDLSYFLEAVPPCFVWFIEKFLNNCLLCVGEGGVPWGGGVGAVGGGQARANGGRWGVNKTMRNENWKGWRIIRRIANEELGIYYAC